MYLMLQLSTSPCMSIKMFLIIKQQALGCLVLLLMCFPCELKKRTGAQPVVSTSTEKWMVLVCEQMGYPEVGRILCMDRSGERQHRAEEDRVSTAHSTTALTDTLSAEVKVLVLSP